MITEFSQLPTSSLLYGDMICASLILFHVSFATGDKIKIISQETIRVKC
jgi:hypothetical protein